MQTSSCIATAVMRHMWRQIEQGHPRRPQQSAGPHLFSIFERRLRVERQVRLGLRVWQPSSAHAPAEIRRRSQMRPDAPPGAASDTITSSSRAYGKNENRSSWSAAGDEGSVPAPATSSRARAGWLNRVFFEWTVLGSSACRRDHQSRLNVLWWRAQTWPSCPASRRSRHRAGHQTQRLCQCCCMKSRGDRPPPMAAVGVAEFGVEVVWIGRCVGCRVGAHSHRVVTARRTGRGRRTTAGRNGWPARSAVTERRLTSRSSLTGYRFAWPGCRKLNGRSVIVAGSSFQRVDEHQQHAGNALRRMAGQWTRRKAARPTTPRTRRYHPGLAATGHAADTALRRHRKSGC